MRIVKVTQPFDMNLDNGTTRSFGPGETVPRDLAGHWWVQAQIPRGFAVEEGGEYDEDEDGSEPPATAATTATRGRGRPSKAAKEAEEALAREEAERQAALNPLPDAMQEKAREEAAAQAREVEAERVRAASTTAKPGETVGPVKSTD